MNKEMKTAITDFWKVFRVVEAKFNDKRQNLDSYSKNGKQNYKQNKHVQ